jgi:hypothetical protein
VLPRPVSTENGGWSLAADFRKPQESKPPCTDNSSLAGEAANCLLQATARCNNRNQARSHEPEKHDAGTRGVPSSQRRRQGFDEASGHCRPAVTAETADRGGQRPQSRPQSPSHGTSQPAASARHRGGSWESAATSQAASLNGGVRRRAERSGEAAATLPGPVC